MPWWPRSKAVQPASSVIPAASIFALASPNSGTGHRDKRYAVVHDRGKLINPMIVEGQVHGGVAQGVGGALYEKMVYDGHGRLRPSSRTPWGHPAGRTWSRTVPDRRGAVRVMRRRAGGAAHSSATRVEGRRSALRRRG
ncbi:molybdopterin cofactor-binding domain-containing protein [Streptosporangium sp. G11]|uniref:molybdopterin cofactor-binding domain-containing protein n=1 Tax=Streptosporangium sp. G11 TaxID=3436926 RepID=UPI003EC0BB0B